MKILLLIAAGGVLAGCNSSTTTRMADVAPAVRTSLNQSGYKDVTVTDDRDKGVVTLNGHVPDPNGKAQAESVAKSAAGGQVVANEIAVLPPGVENDAKKINAALDKGIENNLDAALINNRMRDNVKYSVKNNLVTLTGEVRTQEDRARVEQIAGAVPNVQQVVNELQVKNQPATSTR